MSKIQIDHRHQWLEVFGTAAVRVMWCERCGCLLTDHRVEKSSAYSFPDYWAQSLTPKSQAPSVAIR